MMRFEIVQQRKADAQREVHICSAHVHILASELIVKIVFRVGVGASMVRVGVDALQHLFAHFSDPRAASAAAAGGGGIFAESSVLPMSGACREIGVFDDNTVRDGHIYFWLMVFNGLVCVEVGFSGR